MRHKITKRHLKEGNIIPIYLNFKEQKNLRGNAILIKRIEEREPPKEQKTYEFAVIGDYKEDRKKDKITVLYNWQWWKIKFVDGPEKNFETAVRIAYYQRTFWQKNIEE